MNKGEDQNKILIVHDEPAELNTIATELGSRGFECVAARNPVEALTILQQDEDARIRSAVIDRVFGGPIDGIELMASLGKERPSLDTIILTAYGGVDIGLTALQRGAYRYFMAPYNYDEIAIAIRYLHERRNAIALQTKTLKCTHEQLAWLQSYIDCIPDEVILINSHYEILLVNRAKQEFLASRAKQERLASRIKTGQLVGQDQPDDLPVVLVGRKCHQAIERKEDPCGTCVTRIAFEGKTVGPTWHEWGPEESPRVAEITAGPIRGAHGEVVAVIEVVRDATMRKRLNDITIRLEQAASLGSVQSIVTSGPLRLGAERVRLYLYSDGGDKLVGVMASGRLDHDLISLFDSGSFTLDVSAAGPPVPRMTIDKREPVLYRRKVNGVPWQLKLEGPKWVCEAPEVPYASELHKEDVVEWLELPLVAGNKIIGILSLDRKQSATPFSDSDYQVFATFASIAAQAIENAMDRQHTEALQRVEAQISPETSLEDALTRILDAACSVVPESSGHVRLLSETHDALEMRAGVGGYWGTAPRFRPLGEAVSGWVAKFEKPVVVEDAGSDTALAYPGLSELRKEAAAVASSSLKSFFAQEGSFVCLPITYGGELLLGTFAISSKRRYAFTRRLAFLCELVKFAASAVYTSRLLRQMQSQVRHLGRLHEEAKAMQASRNLSKTVFTVLTALTYRGGLEFNRALLFVVDGQSLTCKLAIGPSSDGEAARIYRDPMWSDRIPPSLRVLGNLYEEHPEQYLQAPIMSLAKGLGVQLSESGQLLCRALDEKRTLICQSDALAPDDKLRVLGGGEFAVAPLVIEGDSIGIIYVDNRFTPKKFTPEAISLLELFASHTAVAIHNAGERERLGQTYRQAYDSVAADTAHSLGNVLAPIAAKLRVLRMTSGASDAILLKQLAELENLYEAAASLVDQIKKCTVEITLALQPVDLGSRIESILEERPEGRRCALNRGGRDWAISGDRLLLDELFRELFQNADNVGATLLDVSLRLASSNADVPRVEIVLRDEGPGVPAESKEDIFKPHFSLRRNGTGLGLYRVRRIVEAHCGQIWECGVGGKGAEFHVVFPLKTVSSNGKEEVEK